MIRFSSVSRIALAIETRMAEAQRRQRIPRTQSVRGDWNRESDEELAGEIKGYARMLVDLRAIGEEHAA